MRYITHIRLKFTSISNMIFFACLLSYTGHRNADKEITENVINLILSLLEFLLLIQTYFESLFTRCDVSDSKHCLSLGKLCNESLSYSVCYTRQKD